jgi:hypothetical protein
MGKITDKGCGLPIAKILKCDNTEFNPVVDRVATCDNIPVVTPVPAFATPAQTIAGTATNLIVNPADLYARENIPAQTGLGLVLSAIPAPAANQSNWGTNTLGEILHYMPGVGWQLVNKGAHLTTIGTSGTTAPGTDYLYASIIAPRDGVVDILQNYLAQWSSQNQQNIVQSYIIRNGIVLQATNASQFAYDSNTNNFIKNISVLAGDLISFGLSVSASSASSITNIPIASRINSITYTA